MRRSPTPCLICGTPSSQGRCPQHRTRQARGYSESWLQISAAAIREQPWCTYCGAVTDLTGDHRVPLSRGGTSTPGNCVVACRPCNSAKKAR